MNKRWLITGGCGFIGINLLKRIFLKKGNSVRIVDNFKSGKHNHLINNFPHVRNINIDSKIPPLKDNDCQLIQADIINYEIALKVCSDIDNVVHLAANTGVTPSINDPLQDCFTNVIGTVNYLDAARKTKVKSFIFASSGAPAGDVEPPIHEEIVPKPVSPYGSSKLAGEAYCSSFYKTFNLNTIALRFGNVYGPGSIFKESVVAKFIKNAISNKPIFINGDGNQTRDFIYVDDIVSAILLASESRGLGGNVFQIATYKETTVFELANKIKKLVKDKLNIDTQINFKSPLLGDVKRNYSDTTKAQDMLLWKSKTNLDKGLNETLIYFTELRKIGN